MYVAIDETAINIFTDGSSYSHPRRGGVGIVYVTVGADGHEVTEEYCPAGYSSATNNQMEIQACVEALEYLSKGYCPIDVDGFRKAVIFSDSMYVVDNVYNARFVWPRQRWTTVGGAPVANAQLWKRLIKSVDHSGLRVEFKWVKGHKASAGNKAADRLAKRSAKGHLQKPLSQVSVRRKQTSKSIEVGSVVPKGQRLTIRIISTEYLSVQRCWKYRYEVISKGSEFHGNVDFIYSDRAISLRDGHSYFVVLNDVAGNPRIRRMIREIAKKTG